MHGGTGAESTKAAPEVTAQAARSAIDQQQTSSSFKLNNERSSQTALSLYLVSPASLIIVPFLCIWLKKKKKKN